VKVHGTVLLPYEIGVGGAIAYVSGTTWARTFNVPLPQGIKEVLAEPSGTRRLDPTAVVDLRIDKRIRLGKTRIQLMADAFNLFNRSVATSVTTLTGPALGTATAASAPRTFRIGVRFDF
jgi:outer membrane receptor protein involved in Fe transport